MNCVDSRAEPVQQMGGVKCVCVREQTPCFCGQEVLGHTRFWFDKDPKLSSFSACLNMVLSSTSIIPIRLEIWYSMFSAASAKQLI